MNRRINRFSPFFAAGGLWAFGIALLLSGEASLAADPKVIANAMAQLADVDPAVRDKASKTLWQAGLDAEPALLAALKNEDPEVVARCREILLDFKYGINPDTPQDIVALIQTCRRGNPTVKRAAVQGLLEIGRRGYPAAVRLAKAEDNQAIRSQVFRELAKVGARGAVGYLAEGDVESAEQCLKAGSDAQNSRAYAAFLLLRGNTDEKIAALRAEMELGDGISNSARLLAYLLRAKGDLNGAREAAEQARDDELFDGILGELGAWKMLAARHAGDGETSRDTEKLGLRAAYQRLAGETEAANHTLDLIAGIQFRAGDNPLPAAKALLLNDRPQKGIDLLLRGKDVVSALELLMVQQKYEEALALGTQAKEAKAIYLARMARTMGQLGEKQQAETALRDAISAAATSGMPAWVAIVDAEVRSGQRTNALNHAAMALGQFNAPAPKLFEKLFGKDAVDAEAWWPIFRSRYASEKPAAIMARLDGLVSGKWGREELAELGREITEGNLADLADRRVLRAAISTFHKAGLEEQARACSRVLADVSQDDRDLVALAAAAVTQKDWLTAAEVSIRAIEKDRSRAAPLYLRGYCLAQLGREKEGREMMDLALLLPLANDKERFELAEFLEQAGLSDAARGQQELLLRTGNLNGQYVSNVSRLMGYRASHSGDDVAAASYWERANLICLRDEFHLAEVVAYLGVAHQVHRSRARALIKAGKLEAAFVEVSLCEEYLPGDISLVIELAPLLREAGHEKDLKKLVENTAKRQEAILSRYPKAVTIHNSIAWLLARCRVDLPLALTHAQRAIALEPDNAKYLDTLAETHFQLGEKDKAIALIRNCIQLEPGVEQHKKQLKRFQEASPDSPPPSY